MRPRQLKTLKDLEDWLHQFKSQPDVTHDTPVFIETPNTELLHPTVISYGSDGPNAKPFITFEYWTDDNLSSNAAHNDKLGTAPHYVS